MRVNLTSRRSSVCSPGNIGVHSYRLSLESRHRRQEARCFNIEHAELLLREALQSSIVFVVSIYGINSILDARTGHAFAKIERGATRQAVISQLGKPDVTRPCGKNLWWGGDGDYLGRNDGGVCNRGSLRVLSERLGSWLHCRWSGCFEVSLFLRIKLVRYCDALH